MAGYIFSVLQEGITFYHGSSFYMVEESTVRQLPFFKK
jgi:hypothetical protein